MGQAGSKADSFGRESERLVSAGPAEPLRLVLRCLAAAMIGCGFWTALSAGVCILSSCLVITQGFLWLADAADAATFARALEALRRRDRGTDACCACHVRHFGVAVAGIVVGALETIELTVGAC